MWQSWTNAILGIWLTSAAFLGLDPVLSIWNDLIVGVVVAISSLTIMKERQWQGWLAMVFGAWMIIAVFIRPLTGGIGYVYNDLISGLIITIAGFASMGRRHEERLA